ncbi:RagB/SusD family nutrient uptake outer membrane protein [Massilibacteroides vaginae]|uniref:RagB/SusD family nutrient uptake outer membrane protein n=1 Tax=Massilibacteroides vaginae TaxID=1673718 RepID=UPI000A1CDCD9|nr:RagB/SusD family nutrient uptake outer membrane protein [Massilibacteroides vaginae]
MKNKILYILISFMVIGHFTCCNEDSWLQRTPKDRITDEQLWNDPNMILGLLANYYDRLPQLAGVFNTGTNAELDDAMWSGHVDQNSRNDFNYADDYGRYWDYKFIRDINLAMENMELYSQKLTDLQKKQFKAEFRFLRAYVYFELVKRMGGVPLVTTQLIYDGSGDPTSLQMPRAKEAEIYDFIYDEIQIIQDDFIQTQGSRTRANKYTALALQSRVMLYAASIAKYNSQMGAPISTPGGEIGIPEDRANEYYQKSLTASEAIIASSEYTLYNPVGVSKGESFYKLFMDKSVSEVIFAKDFMTGKVHGFTYENVVRSFRSDIEGSSMLSPSLSLVECFDYLDGSKGTLRDKDAVGNYIAYENMSDIFANKDMRLYGTVVYPGSNFRSQTVDIQAGVAVWENDRYSFRVGDLGTIYDDGKTLTGFDGPRDNDQYVSNTGFYIRKYVSENAQDGVRPSLASNWWVWFRLGEIYLNAAEAAFELGLPKSKDYINTIREKHGGFPANSIEDLTIDIIQNERRVELAFEDHRFFDLKRWRIADKILNGQDSDVNAVVHGLYPYRICRPGHENDGKYIFERMKPTRFKKARFFRPANYYSSIEQKVLDNNPKLIKNPFH